MIENLKDQIEDLMQRYNGDHDIGVDFNWVDADILYIIKNLLKVIEQQEARIEDLENPSEYDAVMLRELGSRGQR